jgi:hypothetical protein
VKTHGSLKTHQCQTRSPKSADSDVKVISETRGEIAIGPAASGFQFLRQIPVIERAKRTDFRFEKSVGEALVVVEALGIASAETVGLDAGPRDGEAVTSQV